MAQIGETLAARPVELLWGSEGIVSGMPFYLPKAKPLTIGPLSTRRPRGRRGAWLLIVCTSDDEGCRQNAKPFIDAGAPSKTVTLTRSFLGFSAKPVSFQITAVPPG